MTYEIRCPSCDNVMKKTRNYLLMLPHQSKTPRGVHVIIKCNRCLGSIEVYVGTTNDPSTR